MAVITISRQFGSGARNLGRTIADTLGYTFADSDVIEMIAEKANVTAAWVESVEKEAGTRFKKVISRVFPQKMLDLFMSSGRGYFDEKLYLDYLIVIIAQLAEEGNVVIMGRGSQYILRDHPDAFHVLLVDEFENRVRHVERDYHLSYDQSLQFVLHEDRRRKGIFQILGKSDYDSPGHYHLILNMGTMDLDTAAQLVFNLIQP